MDWVNLICKLVSDIGIGGFTVWGIWKFILKKYWNILNNAASIPYVDDGLNTVGAKIDKIDKRIERYNEKSDRQYISVIDRIDKLYDKLITPKDILNANKSA